MDRAGSSPGYRSQAQRIGFAELVAAAFGLLAESWAVAWPAWVGVLALEVALPLAAPVLGVNPDKPPLTLAGVGYVILEPAGAAVFLAVAARAMLGQAATRWRADAGLAAFVAASVALSLLVSPPEALARAAGVPWLVMGGGGGPLGALLALLLFVGMMLAGARLELWLVALALGRRDVGPARSWRLMRRATLSYVLADVSLLIVLGLAAALVAQLVGFTTPGARAANATADAALTMFDMAAGAALYRWRVLGGEEALAEVFG